jgi:two-component system sensor histidine kinase HydH
MVGSVSHELRNPLGSIGTAAYLLNMLLDDNADKDAHEAIAIIDAEVQHAQKIIHDLLDSLRIRHAEPCPVEVLDLVAQALRAGPAGEKVEVLTQIPTGLARVLCDPQQIVQVLTNLIINAYQAMGDGGQLVVTGYPRDDSISVSVSDTGSGISPDVAAHLFEPLFTTKDEGTGLGLMICKSLVEANQGTIEVESTGVPGQGSTFTILLPAAKPRDL